VQQTDNKQCNTRLSVSASDRVSARPDTGMLFYVRRVPKEVAHLDDRKVIRLSLKTRDPVIGGLKARQIDGGLETFWSALLKGEDAKTSWQKYQAGIDLARSLGFTYRPLRDLVAGGLTEELAARINAAKEVVDNPKAFDAILGGEPEPALKLSEVWQTYSDVRALNLAAMSPAQLKLHKQQRETAISYAIGVIGDKALQDIIRGDTLRFQRWWIEKVQKDGLTVEAPNKSFSNIKGMITQIDKALHTDFGTVWAGLALEATAATKARPRLPYSNEFIQDVLLARGALNGMNEDARLIMYLMVETGLRSNEVCNARSEDIVLDHKIPHIRVAERIDRVQKTAPSIRSVPLVGVSLWAARQRPNGFDRYRDKANSFSAAANKFLLQNKMQPTDQHSVYSLRHSFQDRITAAWVPDRVQADLMGHAFDREKYGEGASLAQKLEVLDKIKFQWSE